MLSERSFDRYRRELVIVSPDNKVDLSLIWDRVPAAVFRYLVINRMELS